MPGGSGGGLTCASLAEPRGETSTPFHAQPSALAATNFSGVQE